MRSLSLHLIAILVVCAASLQPVKAAECPTITLPEQMRQDTRDCLVILDESFPTFSPDINLRSKRNRILIDNSKADQELFIGVFFIKYCELIGESRWNIPPDDRLERLALAQEKLYYKVPFRPPAIDSRLLTMYQSEPQSQFVAGTDYEEVQLQHAILTNVDDPFDEYAVDHHIETEEKPSEYLRERPYVVTDANKNFIQISSVPSRQDAMEEVKRLKRMAPQFDFIAYEPYSGNTWFAIMMATWVSDSVANAALKDARKFGLGGKIWSCRQRGSSC